MGGPNSPELLLILYDGMSPCLDRYVVYRDILYGKIEKIRMKVFSITIRGPLPSISADVVENRNMAEFCKDVSSNLESK